MNIRKIFRIAKRFEKLGVDPRPEFAEGLEPSPEEQLEEEAPPTVREPARPALVEPTEPAEPEPVEDERWPGPAAELSMKESMIDYVIKYLNRNIERDRKAIASHQARGTKSEKQIAGLVEHLNKIEEIIATLDDSIKRQRLRIAP